MKLILPDWIGAPSNVGACSTVRSDGFSRAPYDDGTGSGLHGFNLGVNVGDDLDSLARNRQRLQAVLPDAPVWLHQVHGTVIVDAGQVREGREGREGRELQQVQQAQRALVKTKPIIADASFTDVPGVVCILTTADCLPVLLTDMRGTVVAAVHAGWRGLAAGILQQTIAAMRARGAGELMAWLGPAIGAQHFEVGVEVVTAMIERIENADAAFRRLPGDAEKYLADLYHLARLVLGECGVWRIAGGQYCTFSQSSQFYSFRRDRITGRMATMIWIKTGLEAQKTI